MFKFLHIILTASILFLCLPGNSQQPVVVKSFEYIWQRGSRVIIAEDDSIKLLIKNSFAKAFQQRWNIAMPEVSFSVKPLPVLSYTPKFNTKLKDTEQGKWYLFLQVFDKGNLPKSYNDENTFSTILEVKCKLISGTNDSVIMDRALTVNIYTEPSLDQLELIRLPAYPISFVSQFDSIATWLFQSEAISQKSVILKPACVFQRETIKENPLSQLTFNGYRENIQHLSQPTFSLHTMGPKYEKTGVRRNTGGNIISGALTLFTGIRSSKNRSFEYNADFPFEDGDSTYHCIIKYLQNETAELERERVKDNGTTISSVKSADYTFLERSVDPGVINVVTSGADTLATFKIKYAKVGHNIYDRMWDGSDSATIIYLPPDWNTQEDETYVELSGKIGADSFSMKTAKEQKIKEFYINDQLVTVLHGKEKPINGFVFRQLSPRLLKLFTILSSIPYSYFHSRD